MRGGGTAARIGSCARRAGRQLHGRRPTPGVLLVSAAARSRVLFVSYGGGHVSMVLPVIRELERSGADIECLQLALTTGHLKARAVRPALGYRDFLHLVDREAVQRWGQHCSAGNTSPDVPLDETIAYLGINYLDLIAQYGEGGAAQRFAAEGRYGFRPLHFMRRLIDAIGPDLVVATNSPRSEQAALEVAVERGIPSLGMVDLFGLDSDSYVLRVVKPKYTCVIAESVRQRLLQRGFNPEGVVVTGNPAFDGLSDPQNLARAQEFLTRRGWQGKKVILNAGAWEPMAHPATDIPAGRSFPIAIEGILRSYVRQRPDTALILRYHPGDWFEYPRQADDPQVHFSEPPHEPIHPLILAASVVTNTNSTVGLESAVAGKPVISIENSPSVHVWFSLARLGVSYPSPTHLDLPATLDRVLADPQPMRAFQSDGRAAARVAGVVLQALDDGASISRKIHSLRPDSGV